MSRRTYYEVAGRTVLITGAARGIGLETARRLHGRGANVALVGLEPEELERHADALGDGAAWFEADVTDPATLEAAVAATVERFGGLDVVVANAGVAPRGSVASIDPDDFARTIEVNLLGVFRTVRAALPYVVARQGYVLCIASAAALVHAPLMASYTASKAGVEAFGDSLRSEIAHTGTKVGVAYFSFIDTDMVRKGFDSPSARHVREHSGGPFVSVAPLSDAIDAIEEGVLRRARTVVAPRWVRPMLWLRTPMQRVSELAARRSHLDEAVRLAEAEASELTTPQPSR